jgi:hypothetical protein
MTSLGYAALALGATQAGLQIASGISASKQAKYEGEYNASIYEQQAKMIEEQKGLESYQYSRGIARMKGMTIARTAKSGLMMGGSPLAIMIDNETQMQLDKSVGQYNLNVQKQYALSGARYYRYSGNEASKAALFSGYTNAFSTLLSTGFNSSMMSMPQRAGKI